VRNVYKIKGFRKTVRSNDIGIQFGNIAVFTGIGTGCRGSTPAWGTAPNPPSWPNQDDYGYSSSVKGGLFLGFKPRECALRARTPCLEAHRENCWFYFQQFSVWASKLRVRTLRMRTLSFEARKQAAFGGLFAG